MSGSPPRACHILVLTGRISLLVVSLANIWPQVDWRVETLSASLLRLRLWLWPTLLLMLNSTALCIMILSLLSLVILLVL